MLLLVLRRWRLVLLLLRRLVLRRRLLPLSLPVLLLRGKGGAEGRDRGVCQACLVDGRVSLSLGRGAARRVPLGG